jgi:hypothetical protein
MLGSDQRDFMSQLKGKSSQSHTLITAITGA